MLLLLTALVLALSAPQTSSDRVAIYVFAQPSATGFTDVNQQQRAQSVADLTRRLSKKKDVVVVADPAAADLQLEVLDHDARKATGNFQTAGTAVFGVAIASTKAERMPAVLVALRAGDYLLEIEGRDKRAKYAAEAVADHVVKWVTENRTQIAQRRSGPQH